MNWHQSYPRYYNDIQISFRRNSSKYSNDQGNVENDLKNNDDDSDTEDDDDSDLIISEKVDLLLPPK